MGPHSNSASRCRCGAWPASPGTASSYSSGTLAMKLFLAGVLFGLFAALVIGAFSCPLML